MATEEPTEGVEIAFELPPVIVSNVDAYAAQNGLTRLEALRYIVEDWLIAHGMLPVEDEGE